MGHYSLLDIGRIHLEFKYRMPYVCTILFEPQELRVEVHEEEGYPYCEFAGYQTTAQAAIKRLQHHGYNEAFYSTVLAPHLEDFEDFYLDTLIGDAPSEVSMKEASEHARFLETLDIYQVSALLAYLSKEEDPQRKGHLLEDICCQIFTLSSGLSIESTRLNNKDEELDIVLLNNITRSFFISLRLPIILVECKNWSSSVSASVLRDFESKVRNHSNLCRIGIFVALNGFASTDREVLRRLGRDNIVLVLVTGDNLRELVEGTNTIEDWLERLIARSLR